MNTLSNYPGFKEEVLSEFEGAIKKHPFKFIELSEEHFVLAHSNCEIEISFDRGDVFLMLKIPSYGGFKTHLYQVFKHFNPNDPLVQKVGWQPPKEQLTDGGEMLFRGIDRVLAGDFSWVENLKSEQRKLRLLLLFLNEFPRSSAIRKKFSMDDATWVKDLTKYVEENKIDLERECESPNHFRSKSGFIDRIKKIIGRE